MNLVNLRDTPPPIFVNISLPVAESAPANSYKLSTLSKVFPWLLWIVIGQAGLSGIALAIRFAG